MTNHRPTSTKGGGGGPVECYFTGELNTTLTETRGPISKKDIVKSVPAIIRLRWSDVIGSQWATFFV